MSSTALQIQPGGNVSADASVIAPERAQTAVAAASAQAKAEVEARYLMARAQPRDMNLVYQRLMKECERPAFADSALYSRPVGGGKNASGLSIRFAEAAVRCMGNIDASSRVLYDDEDRRLIRVIVTDLETNAHFSEDIVLEKTVERLSPPKGSRIISQRTNSQGKITYTIPASEVDLVPKQRALESKAIRNCLLRLLPGDFADDAKLQIGETRRKQDRTDPKGALKRILLGFANLNIPADQLAEYVGHSLDSVSPAEIGDLRNVYAAVRDGEMAWHETLADRRAERSGGGKSSKAKESGKTLDDLKGSPSPLPPDDLPGTEATQPDDSPEAEDGAKADTAAAIEEIAASSTGKKGDAIRGEVQAALAKHGADSVDALPLEPMRDLYARMEAMR